MSQHPIKENLTAQEIVDLKRRFKLQWPDAARALEYGPDTTRGRLASCMWLGFKRGYQVGRDLWRASIL